MADPTEKDALFLVLGEIKGELKGIRDQIVESNLATNRRIDDLARSVEHQTESLNRRIDDHQEDTSVRFNSLETRVSSLEKHSDTNKRNAVITSGSVSTIITVASEAIKAVMR